MIYGSTTPFSSFQGENSGNGNCDGSFNSTRLFHCKPNDGLFVTASDLVLEPSISTRIPHLNDQINNNEQSKKPKPLKHQIARITALITDPDPTDLVDISTKRQIHYPKLKLNGLTNRNIEDQNDKIKLLSDWPQPNFTATPKEVIHNQLKKIQLNTMNRKNTEVKSKSHFYTNDIYPPPPQTSQPIAQQQSGPPQKAQNEVDLIEILQGSWPAEAGDTIAPALCSNNVNNISVASRIGEFERNKSINPVSHLHTKKRSNRHSGLSLSTIQGSSLLTSTGDSSSKSSELTHSKKRLSNGKKTIFIFVKL